MPTPSHAVDSICVVLTISLDMPQPGAARLRLAGHLDQDGARDLLHAAADVVRIGCLRLVVELDDVVSFDDAAAFSVRGCSRLAHWLPQGVEVVATTGIAADLAGRAGLPTTLSA